MLLQRNQFSFNTKLCVSPSNLQAVQNGVNTMNHGSVGHRRSPHSRTMDGAHHYGNDGLYEI